jgi:hypothetical protein
MLQTKLGRNHHHHLYKITIQTLISANVVSMMGTTMPEMTLNDYLMIHHCHHHSIQEITRATKIIVIVAFMTMVV